LSGPQLWTKKVGVKSQKKGLYRNEPPKRTRGVIPHWVELILREKLEFSSRGKQTKTDKVVGEKNGRMDGWRFTNQKD